MTVDPAKLRELAQSLTDDQTKLLREGLGDGGELDADSLMATLNDYENREIFKSFAAERVVAADAGAPDGGVPPDAGTLPPDGGTSHPPHDPPLTRW